MGILDTIGITDPYKDKLENTAQEINDLESTLYFQKKRIQALKKVFPNVDVSAKERQIELFQKRVNTLKSQFNQAAGEYGKWKAERPYQGTGKPSDALRALGSLGAGITSGVGQFSGMLGYALEQLGNLPKPKTLPGISPLGIAHKAGEILESAAKEDQRLAQKIQKKFGLAPGLLAEIYQGIGHSIPDFAAISLTPGGLPVYSAISGAYGAKEAGGKTKEQLTSALKGLATGILLQKSLRGIEGIQSKGLKAAFGTGIFGLPSLANELRKPPEKRNWNQVVSDFMVGLFMSVAPDALQNERGEAAIRKYVQREYGYNLDEIAKKIQKDNRLKKLRGSNDITNEEALDIMIQLADAIRQEEQEKAEKAKAEQGKEEEKNKNAEAIPGNQEVVPGEGVPGERSGKARGQNIQQPAPGQSGGAGIRPEAPEEPQPQEQPQRPGEAVGQEPQGPEVKKPQIPDEFPSEEAFHSAAELISDKRPSPFEHIATFNYHDLKIGDYEIVSGTVTSILQGSADEKKWNEYWEVEVKNGDKSTIGTGATQREAAWNAIDELRQAEPEQKPQAKKSTMLHEAEPQGNIKKSTELKVALRLPEEVESGKLADYEPTSISRLPQRKNYIGEYQKAAITEDGWAATNYWAVKDQNGELSSELQQEAERTGKEVIRPQEITESLSDLTSDRLHGISGIFRRDKSDDVIIKMDNGQVADIDFDVFVRFMKALRRLYGNKIRLGVVRYENDFGDETYSHLVAFDENGNLIGFSSPRRIDIDEAKAIEKIFGKGRQPKSESVPPPTQPKQPEAGPTKAPQKAGERRHIGSANPAGPKFNDESADKFIESLYNSNDPKKAYQLFKENIWRFSQKQLDKNKNVINVIAKRANHKRGNYADWVIRYTRNKELLENKIAEREDNEITGDIKILMARQDRLAREGIDNFGFKDYEVTFANDLINMWTIGKKEAKNNAPKTPYNRAIDLIKDEVIEQGKITKPSQMIRRIKEEFPEDSKKWTPRDIQDMMEIAVNEHLREKKIFDMPVDEAIKYIRELQERLPTQVYRTETQEAAQQFSTPPILAYIVDKLANPQRDDTVLEPSAGNGGLIAMIRDKVKRIIANEIDPIRAKNLEAQGFETIREDAKYIDGLLQARGYDGENAPTVVIMNPPFSSDVTTGEHNNRVGYNQVISALRALPEGGRLVFILGEGAAPDKPNSKYFWDRILRNADVRLIATSSGENYKKYGTKFGNVIGVVDKTAKNNNLDHARLNEAMMSLDEVIGGLKDGTIENRIKRQKIELAHSNENPNDLAGGESKGNSGVGGRKSSGGLSTGNVQSNAKRPGGRPATGGTNTGVSGGTGEGAGEGTAAESQTSAKGPERNKKSSNGTNEAAPGSTGAGGKRTNGPKGPIVTIDEEIGEDLGEIQEREGYVDYRPHIKVKGAKPHPTKLVESAAMAGVEPPKLKNAPQIQQEIIDSGALTDSQMETLGYIVNSHSTEDKLGRPYGFLLADGTGTGKGRVISGLFLHYLNTGKAKRFVWISVGNDLAKDSIEHLLALGMLEWDEENPYIKEIKKANKDYYEKLKELAQKNPQKVKIVQQRNWGVGTDIDAGDNTILFTTYPLLAKNDRVRFEQLMKWIGDDNVVFVMDEAHKAKNAVNEINASITGKMMLEAQELKNIFPVYASASPASSLRNMAYMTRLGLFGPGEVFNSFGQFQSAIGRAGVAGLELVTRSLKAMGRISAKQISYDGVEYEIDNSAKLSQSQIKAYNAAGEIWKKILERYDERYEGQKGNIFKRTYYWGAQLRFFRSLMLGFKSDAIIKRTEQELKNGNSVVISLFETNESQLNRQRKRAAEQNVDIDMMDMSPAETLTNILEELFPEYLIDSEGKPVRDSQGNLIPDPQNKEIRSELSKEIEKIASMLPEASIDKIINYFGADNVAEISGRKHRLALNKQTGQYEYVPRRVEGVPSSELNNWERDNFQTGKKKIALITQAASTGISLHADPRMGNTRRRVFISGQLSWSADQQMQAFGRVHRAFEAVPPKYVLMAVDIGGERRFMASAARKLEALNAVSTGQRESKVNVLSSFNYESEIGETALNGLIKSLYETEPQVLWEMRLIKRGKYGGFEKPKEIKMTQFLNRLLVLTKENQERIISMLDEAMNQTEIEMKAAGKVDFGVTNIKAKKISLIKSEIAFEDEKSGGKLSIDEYDAVRARRLIKLKNIDNLISVGYKIYKSNNERRRIKKYVLAKQAIMFDENGFERMILQTIDGKQSVMPKMSFEREYSEVKTRPEFDKWYEEFAKKEEGKEYTEKLYMLNGAVLPVWDKIDAGLYGNGQARIRAIKFFTDDGKLKIGIQVPIEKINYVRQALGLGAMESTANAKARLLSGEEIHLSNGATIKRSIVAGETAFVIGNILPEEGSALSEKIPAIQHLKYGSRHIFFISADEADAIDDLFSKYPPINLDTGGYNDAAVPDGTDFMETVTGANTMRTQMNNNAGNENAVVVGSPGSESDLNNVIKLSYISKKLVKAIEFKLGLDLRSGLIKRWTKKALGFYDPDTQTIRVNDSGQFAVLAHEIGHYLDRHIFGIRQQMMLRDPALRGLARRIATTLRLEKSKREAALQDLRDKYGADNVAKALDTLIMRAELRKVKNFTPAKVGDNVKEQLAEFFRLYIMAPWIVKKYMPRTMRFYDELLGQDARLAKGIAEVRDLFDKYRQQTPAQKEIAKVVFSKREREGEADEGRRDIFARLHRIAQANYIAFLDFSYIYKKLDAQLRKKAGRAFDSSKSPYHWFKSYLGSFGKVEQWLYDSPFRYKDNFKDIEFLKDVPPLLGKRKGLFKEGRPGILTEAIESGDYEKYVAWAIAQHDMELFALGKGHVTINPTKERAQAVIKEMEEKVGKDKLEEFGANLKKYTDALLDYLGDSGRMDQETIELLKKTYKHYIPYSRVFEDWETISKKDFIDRYIRFNSPKAVYGFKGSTRDIYDPFQALMKATHKIIASADLNMLNKSIVESSELLGLKPVEIPPRVFKKMFLAGEKEMGWVMANEAPKDKPIVTIYENGKRKYFEIDKELYDALKMATSEYSKYTELLSLPAKWLRAGAVEYNMRFGVRNIIRDIQSAMFYTNYNYNPLLHPNIYLKAAAEVLKGGELYQKFKASGADMAFMTSIDYLMRENKLDKTINDFERRNKFHKFNPFIIAQKFNQITENTTRLSVFYDTFQKTGDIMEAMLEAREGTADYAISGRNAQVRAYLMSVAFLNARIRHFLKINEAFYKRPGKTFATGILAFTVPSILLWFWNHRNDDVAQAYEAKRAWAKIGMQLVNIPGTSHFIYLPRSFFHVFFAAPVEQFLSWIYEHNPADLPAIANQALQNWLPGTNVGDFIPTTARPIVENAFNKFTFGGIRDMVPSYIQESRKKKYWYDKYTPEVLIWLGQKFNFAPIHAYNILRGWFGGLGDMAISLPDIVLGVKGRTATPVDDWDLLRKTPAGALMSRDYRGIYSGWANKFYSAISEMKKEESEILDNINEKSHDKAVSYILQLKQNPVRYKKFEWYAQNKKTLNKLAQDIKYVRDLIYNIQQSKMEPDKKRKVIDFLNKQIEAPIRSAYLAYKSFTPIEHQDIIELFHKAYLEDSKKKKAITPKMLKQVIENMQIDTGLTNLLRKNPNNNKLKLEREKLRSAMKGGYDFFGRQKTNIPPGAIW